ncbi:MAG: amino acid ABC transporter permease [Firmicutes bacterium]|nr:amino acid ABC transporter permease [Bacillota bacterium]
MSEFFTWVGKLLNLYWPMFLSGAGTTMLLAISGTCIGFVLGLLVGVVRTIPITDKTPAGQRVILKIVNAILTAYIEIFRGTPMIVQSMVIFYGSAYITGTAPNRIAAGIFIVSINTGAYMAEIVRGGIIAIDRGQFEAAQALGMSHWQTMRCIIIPQVVRNILPATGNEFVINIKDTSVLMIISIGELFYAGRTAAGTYFKYFESFLIIAAIYFVLTFSVTRILRIFERKLEGNAVYSLEQNEQAKEVSENV